MHKFDRVRNEISDKLQEKNKKVKQPDHSHKDGNFARYDLIELTTRAKEGDEASTQTLEEYYNNLGVNRKHLEKLIRHAKKDKEHQARAREGGIWLKETPDQKEVHHYERTLWALDYVHVIEQQLSNGIQKKLSDWINKYQNKYVDQSNNEEKVTSDINTFLEALGTDAEDKSRNSLVRTIRENPKAQQVLRGIIPSESISSPQDTRQMGNEPRKDKGRARGKTLVSKDTDYSSSDTSDSAVLDNNKESSSKADTITGTWKYVLKDNWDKISQYFWQGGKEEWNNRDALVKKLDKNNEHEFDLMIKLKIPGLYLKHDDGHKVYYPLNRRNAPKKLINGLNRFAPIFNENSLNSITNGYRNKGWQRIKSIIEPDINISTGREGSPERTVSKAKKHMMDRYRSDNLENHTTPLKEVYYRRLINTSKPRPINLKEGDWRRTSVLPVDQQEETGAYGRLATPIIWQNESFGQSKE